MIANIIEGMARALFVTAWADYEGEQGRTYSGMELTEVAPATPPLAVYEAWRLLGMYEDRNDLHIACLVSLARKADGIDHYDQDARGDIPPDMLFTFGWYLAMMAMGHGVSWFDDHERFDLRVPQIESLQLENWE